jgi:hypothetical protein
MLAMFEPIRSMNTDFQMVGIFGTRCNNLSAKCNFNIEWFLGMDKYLIAKT